MAQGCVPHELECRAENLSDTCLHCQWRRCPRCVSACLLLIASTDPPARRLWPCHAAPDSLGETSCSPLPKLQGITIDKVRLPVCQRKPPQRAWVSLVAQRPQRDGGQREHCYLYDVILDDEVIVSNSRDAECDLARVLLAKDSIGEVTMLDANTGKPRTIIVAAESSCSDNYGTRFARCWLLGADEVDFLRSGEGTIGSW